MARLIVLGAGGMLGQKISDLASESDIDLVRVGRGGHNSFRYPEKSLLKLAQELDWKESDYVVNCIGWIPQRAVGSTDKDAKDAFLLNELLIRDLQNLRTEIGFSWIQILTDCVFSGNRGGYLEQDSKDATDLYGLSKIAGEEALDGAIAIRSSIIGPDRNSVAGLFSWFQSSIKFDSRIPGFVNVKWNGVSTLAFAKLTIGLFLEQRSKPLLQHWIPSDSVSKFELLKFFADGLGIGRDVVVPVSAEKSVDKTLATQSPDVNVELWRIAGYSSIPSIEYLCAEFISQHRSNG